MAKLSVVISAFNEEKNITDCLESVRWADEIILVDNTSTDKTVEMAGKYGAKIYNQPNKLMLNINKNFGFEKASGDWILNLDADERVSPELAREIDETIKQWDDETTGYWISRKNILFGKWIQHSLWWPDEQLRLFKKGKGKFAEQQVHEYLETEGKTGHLQNPITHYNYSSVSQFLNKMDRIYSENEAESFIKSGKKIVWSDAVKWPVGDFLKTYFLQEGYKDGLHGLVLSVLQAFYTEVLFAKVWEKQGFREENIDKEEIINTLKDSQKEVNYWLRTIEIKGAKKPKRLILRILRKLRL